MFPSLLVRQWHLQRPARRCHIASLRGRQAGSLTLTVEGGRLQAGLSVSNAGHSLASRRAFTSWAFARQQLAGRQQAAAMARGLFRAGPPAVHRFVQCTGASRISLAPSLRRVSFISGRRRARVGFCLRAQPVHPQASVCLPLALSVCAPLTDFSTNRVYSNDCLALAREGQKQM